MNLFKKITFVATSNYYTLILNFLSLMVLSRILNITDFGIITLWLAIYTCFQLIIDALISPAIIQKKTLTRINISDFFKITILVTSFTFLILFFLQQIILINFRSNGIQSAYIFLYLNVLFFSLSLVPSSLMRRNLEFSMISKIEIIGVTVSCTLAIICAYLDFSYWALVIQQLSLNFVKFILYNIHCKIKLSKKKINFNTIRYLYKYSLNITLFSFINYWSRNIDTYLVENKLGSSGLGLYGQAYKLMTLPNQLITSIANVVIHPIFAIMHRNKKINSETYVEVLAIISFLAVPCFFMLHFYPTTVITLIWGDKWIESAKYLEILSYVILFQPALATTGDVFKAVEKTKLLLMVGLMNTVMIVIALLIGSYYSIEAMCWAYVVSYLFFITPITYGVMFKFIFKKINFNKRSSYLLINSIILFILLYIIFYIDITASFFISILISLSYIFTLLYIFKYHRI
ncbi:MAG: oligosaccharide flippase family protein [Acinetobacter pittii]|jgi:PST family polysaccharide transporter|nr:oligosaccharide flippase family protein [Vagococcus sp.]MDR3039340.1 oligosaccharide flippase family protein [Acinetobacter pittii]